MKSYNIYSYFDIKTQSHLKKKKKKKKKTIKKKKKKKKKIIFHDFQNLILCLKLKLTDYLTNNVSVSFNKRNNF